MTILERIKKAFAWSILNTGLIVALTVTAGWLIFTLGVFGYMLVTAPMTFLGMLVGGGLIILVFSAAETFNHKVIKPQWAKVIKWAKKTSPDFRDLDFTDCTWSGSQPDELWMVVSESGRAMAGPTCRENAERCQKELEPMWGKCTIVLEKDLKESQVEVDGD